MMFMPFTESKYLGLAVKVPLPISRGIFYISPVGFFRNSNYDHVTVTWEDQIDRNVVERYYDSASVNRNAYGAKFLFGLRPIVKISKETALEFDLYAGLVVEKQNENEKAIAVVPSLHLGFRIGLRF
jgi:hypothetical protein